jgi:hypothetical protein
MNAGYFGYIIGKKCRFMKVEQNADLLWQILIREIYVLMKKFDTIENMKEAFEKIKVAKNEPSVIAIKKCQVFNEECYEFLDKWSNMLAYCQGSYINLLEAGYIINYNEKEPFENLNGYKFILDFNKNSATFSFQPFLNSSLHISLSSKITNKSAGNKNQSTGNNNKTILETATIDEIMRFENISSQPYSQIVDEMNERFTTYYAKLSIIEKEIIELKKMKESANRENNINIEIKIDTLISDKEFELSQLKESRRFFYYRLKALDLLEE